MRGGGQVGGTALDLAQEAHGLAAGLLQQARQHRPGSVEEFREQESERGMRLGPEGTGQRLVRPEALGEAGAAGSQRKHDFHGA